MRTSTKSTNVKTQHIETASSSARRWRLSLCRFVVSMLFLCVAVSAQGQTVRDNFQSYAVGSFPAPLWSDVGPVLPEPPFPPNPSAMVIATTDAFGNPTKALSTAGELGISKGIYTPISISSFYSLSADVRVDRYSDHPDLTITDWPMQLTFAEAGVDNFFETPQAGIYASSQTQGWRLFLLSPFGQGGPFADIDLGAPANVGTWYHLQLTLDAATGTFHSQVTEIATGQVLVDRNDTIGGWNPALARYDSFAFFAGDGGEHDTVGNIGVVDNVNVASGPHTLKFYLHGNDIPGTAGGFTMNLDPAPSQTLSLDLISAPSWFSDPALTGTFQEGGIFRLTIPCTAGLSVARTFRLLVTGPDGRDGQVLGETTEVLSLCRGKQTIRIPVSLPITLTNQRLQLIISSAVSANVNLQMGAGTFLEATRFVGTP